MLHTLQIVGTCLFIAILFEYWLIKILLDSDSD